MLARTEILYRPQVHYVLHTDLSPEARRACNANIEIPKTLLKKMLECV